MIMPEGLLDKLNNKGISSIDNYSSEDIYWGLIVDYAKKKTRNKKPYMLLTILGTSGKKHRVFCWGTPADAELNTYRIYALQLKSGDFGFSTNWRKTLELKNKNR